jgi:hypothetical protein
VNERRAENCSAHMSGLGLDKSGFGGYIRKHCRICPIHLEIFFLTLILQLWGIKLDETWKQWPPQYKEQVSKEVLTKSKDFLSDFVWTRKIYVFEEMGEIHQIEGAGGIDSLQC